ncbi:MAG: hypothetical protein JW750_04875 [Anaerolineaceae bacterium]|nr:hypothetical protein [Anaerolineaceae bacterium]
MFKRLKEKISNANNRQMIIVVIVVIAFFVLLNLNSRINVLLDNMNKRDQRATDVLVLYATEVYLRTEIAHAQSDQAIEEIAREGGYVQPGDVPIAPLPVEGEAAVEEFQLRPTPTPKKYENWEVWRALFKDEE